MPQAIASFISTIRLWLITYWPRRRNGSTTPNGQDATAIASSDEPAHSVPAARSASSRSADIEATGRWYFRRNILDQLDLYFPLMKRLRIHDPDAYDLYSRIGAICLSPKGELRRDRIDVGSDPALMSGFGAVAWLGHEHDEAAKIYPRFWYFQKQSRPSSDVFRAPGQTVYEVTLFYAHRRKQKGWSFLSIPHNLPIGFPLVYHLGVSRDGSIRVLKERIVRYSRLPPTSAKRTEATAKHKGQYHRGASDFAQVIWDFPFHLKSYDKDGEEVPCDPQERGRELFAMAYNGYVNASMDARIRVEKDEHVAAFSVDLLRMPYFFSDRDKTNITTINGKRRPIFHIVRTHARHTETVTSYVRSHFRGSRRFLWNGYAITITMPGKHHGDLLTFTEGTHVFDEGEKIPRRMTTLKRLGQRLEKHTNV